MLALQQAIKKITFYKDKLTIQLNLNPTEVKDEQIEALECISLGEANCRGTSQPYKAQDLNIRPERYKASSNVLSGELIAFWSNMLLALPHLMLGKTSIPSYE